VAIAGDLARDDRRTLERVETETVRAYRKQALRYPATGWGGRRDGTRPTTEQAIPGHHFAGLKSFRKVLGTTRKKGAKNQGAHHHDR